MSKNRDTKYYRCQSCQKSGLKQNDVVSVKTRKQTYIICRPCDKKLFGVKSETS